MPVTSDNCGPMKKLYVVPKCSFFLIMQILSIFIKGYFNLNSCVFQVPESECTLALTFSFVSHDVFAKFRP